MTRGQTRRGIIERLKRLEQIAPEDMRLLCNVDGELKELTLNEYKAMVYAHSLESFASQTHDFIAICKELEKYGVGVKVMEMDLTMQCDEETDFGMTMM